MLHLPRLAVGTIQPQAQTRAEFWALPAAFEQHGAKIQTFSPQARFVPCDASLAITGQNRRHLDSWLMSPRDCRELFSHGCRASDLALVEGQFPQASVPSGEHGGRLDRLCEWLDLPRVVVLDTAVIQCCALPRRPAEVDAVLLGNVSDCEAACRWHTTIEALWNVPVVGAFIRTPQLQRRLSAVADWHAPARELCVELGERLLETLDVDCLLELASSRCFPAVKPRLFRYRADDPPINVAVAYDDAFRCYFPDTIDLLEARGACVTDFSPLHSERLPAGTDVVYLGCGDVASFAERLAANHCLKQSLRDHARWGGRIYAESAGLAYLCQDIVLPGGGSLPMVGLVPAVASPEPHPHAPEPTEITLAKPSWIGSSGTVLRGYLNNYWRIDPTGGLNNLSGQGRHALALVGGSRIVGSRLHLNFAAQPRLLNRFFRPCRPAALAVPF